MELFKGVMYQHTTTAGRDTAVVRGAYGAHALASELAPALGNGAANARWRSGQPAAAGAGTAAEAPPVAAADAAPGVVATGPRRRREARASWRDIGRQLLFLGGRPMHAGHNLDLDEPFEDVTPAGRVRAPARDCGRLLPC